MILSSEEGEPMHVLIQPYSLYFIWQLDLFINQVNYQYK